MKMSVILLFVLGMQVSAATFGQVITFTQKQATLKQLFAVIRKQTGYDVLYQPDKVNTAIRIDADFKAASLREVLDRSLAGHSLTYTIDEKTVVIRAQSAAPPVQENPVAATIGVTGKVIEKAGQPLAGATVKIKGGSGMVQTDAKGQFRLDGVDEHAVLLISYVGYKTVELNVVSYMVITLESSDAVLDETQVVAYGTTTRRLNTGSVSTVKADDIAKQPVNNILLAMQGRVPGLKITSSSGLPGNSPYIQLRGQNSLQSGTAPLYVLDGVPIPGQQTTLVSGTEDNSLATSALMSINPADVESVDVLKDADATALYGARGSGGVILITTKKAKFGTTNVNVNAYTGAASIGHYINFPDVHQYNASRREALANDHLTPTTSNAPDLLLWDSTKTQNWQKYLLRNAAITSDVNVSISGANATTSFYVNGGHHNEETLERGSTGDTRNSIRFSFDHSSPDKKLGINLTGGYSTNEIKLQYTDVISSINLAPDYPMYLTDGVTPNWNAPRGFPLANLKEPYNNKTAVTNGHIQLRYQPVKGLFLKVDGGVNNSVVNEMLEMPLSAQNPTGYGVIGTLQTGNQNSNNWIVEPTATYTAAKGFHHFTLLAGGSWQKSTGSNLNITATGFPNDALIGNVGSANNKTVMGGSSIYTYNSFYGRLTYDYRQKYLANLSFRRDGSSMFGPGNRFGNFGALALGWIFTEESFVRKSLPFLSFGKLRASYGVVGNDQIANYAYLSTYAAGYVQYQGSTLNPTNIANPYYRWEQTWKFESALELGFLKGRLHLTGSFYQNQTGNQLISYVLPISTGFTGYLTNFPAVIRNRGWELELLTQNITGRALNWSTTLNFAYNRGVLLKFPNIVNTSYQSSLVVGQAIPLIQGYHSMGLDSTGSPVIQDVDKNGSIGLTDRHILGSANPVSGGISNDFSYKGLTLSIFVQFQGVNSFNSVTSSIGSAGHLGYNYSPYLQNRWQKKGDELTTNTPKFSTNFFSNFNYFQSDIFWMTNYIVRLRNISLAYDLPTSILKRIKIKKAQLSLRAENLWASDKLRKYQLDPESGNNMPPLRILTAGINCTL